jgi:hypothetical protein
MLYPTTCKIVTLEPRATILPATSRISFNIPRNVGKVDQQDNWQGVDLNSVLHLPERDKTSELVVPMAMTAAILSIKAVVAFNSSSGIPTAVVTTLNGVAPSTRATRIQFRVKQTYVCSRE